MSFGWDKGEGLFEGLVWGLGYVNPKALNPKTLNLSPKTLNRVVQQFPAGTYSFRDVGPLVSTPVWTVQICCPGKVCCRHRLW